MESHVEVERKYDASVSWELPALADIDGVGAVEEVPAVDLHAIYFDTGDLLLLRHRITLRRRTGGIDEGWHLKLPRSGQGDTSRLEIHQPLSTSTVGGAFEAPAPLIAAIRVHVRDRALIPVAEITTRRTAYLLRAPEGSVLAEVADDRVTGTALDRLDDDASTTQSWHEVEVELVEGDIAILDATESLLLGADASPSASVSKLARTLGADTTRRTQTQPVTSQSDAGTAVRAYVAIHIARLKAFDPDVRANDPTRADIADEAVHQMRVCTRRLRSALATYRPVYEREKTEPVRAELAWIGGLVGALRDVQVIRAELLAAVDELPADQVHGPARRRMDSMLVKRANLAHQQLLEALDGDRYFRLLDSLDAFVETPHLSNRANKPAMRELPRLVRREGKRVASRHKELLRASDDASGDAARHALRRAAKRARYAAEVAEPVCGRDASRFATWMSEIQTSLGNFQDSVIARATLAEAAQDAAAHNEDGFTYGLLIGLQQARAKDALRAFTKVWRTPVRRKATHWLD